LFRLTGVLKVQKRERDHEERGGVLGGVGQMWERFARVPVPSEALHEPEPRGQTRDERPQQPHAFHALGPVDVDGCKTNAHARNVTRGERENVTGTGTLMIL